MLQRWAVFGGLFSLIVLAVAGCSHGAGRLQAQLDEAMTLAPPLPPGYEDPKALQKDLKDGKLRLLGPQDLVLDQTIAVDPNVEYGNADGIPLRLDLFYPKNLSEPAPALVFIHGGGWEHKGKEFYTYWTARYARRGYVCASIEYRVSSEATFPGCVSDAQCAVRWLRASAAQYHIDPDRVAVIGQSAGAHLALMVGYAADVPELTGGCYPDQSSAVQAVVAYYPPTDLTVEELYTKKIVAKFIGAPYSERPELYAAASPMHYVDKNVPPTLLFHGTIDGIVPVAQSDLLAARLEELGVPHLYDREEGWDHVMDVFVDVNKRAMAIQDRFLDTVLRFQGKNLSE